MTSQLGKAYQCGKCKRIYTTKLNLSCPPWCSGKNSKHSTEQMKEIKK